jgi:hypothetical protein
MTLRVADSPMCELGRKPAAFSTATGQDVQLPALQASLRAITCNQRVIPLDEWSSSRCY